MMAPDSAMVRAPSVITGDLPSGCTRRSSGGASSVCGSRWYFTNWYSQPSSSSSHSTRCERELFRWWTTISGGSRRSALRGGRHRGAWQTPELFVAELALRQRMPPLQQLRRLDIDPRRRGLPEHAGIGHDTHGHALGGEDAGQQLH